jgi:parallel beta-helix repeat protein
VVRLRKTILVTTIIFTLLFSTTVVTSYVRFACAQTETVTIKADGSVEPSTAPIQRVGDLYVLAGDVGQITVQRSNITLDGSGHRLSGKISLPEYSATVENSGGVFLNSVKNVTVKNFVIKDCRTGIFLDRASNITVSGNTITGTWAPFTFDQLTAGICVWGGDSNTITGNCLANNMFGIGVGSESNIIVGNTISNSTDQGIRLYASSSNVIYHNNFMDNAQNVYDCSGDFDESPSINSWDNGEEGNFWSDYNGTDANSDGIGDTSYRVDSNNQDGYPLMKPWDPAKPVDTAPPLISVSSPQNKVYNDSSVPLTFSTNEPASQMSYSLDGQDNVTIAGNTTLSGLPNGNHNVTIYATDKAGNVASETISFSVEVPFPVVPVTVASVATIAVMGVALLVYFRKRRH